jgi:hypothetical protein
VLLRLAYLAVTNGLAMLRLLPMSDLAKDVEILALRHQLAVLERQLHGQGHRVRFTPTDRAFLAALLHRLPRQVLHRVRLLVRLETVLRWHRDLIAAQHARISRPKRVGRPRTTTRIGSTGAFPTPGHCTRCPNRSPIDTRSRTYTSTDATASARILHEYERAA